MTTITKAAVNTNGTNSYVGYRNFYGIGKFTYFIYPDDGWDVKKWGPKPFLGTVYADEPFYAVREAYTKGLTSPNSTFGLIALKTRLGEGLEAPPIRKFKGINGKTNK